MKNIRRAAKLCLAKYALCGKVYAMPNRSDAEEHLRIIRSLMEKATIYRAISAPTALVGGLVSIIAACALSTALPAGAEFVPRLRLVFLGGWLAVLAITAAANTWFLWRDACRRGDRFLSAGMRAAVRAFSPSYLAAAFLTALLATSSPEILPPVWMLFYGLGLLATQHFAPRSIALLGWAFFAAGPLLIMADMAKVFESLGVIRHANLAMGATFGLFHLIYAACTWLRRGRGAEDGAQP